MDETHSGEAQENLDNRIESLHLNRKFKDDTDNITRSHTHSHANICECAQRKQKQKQKTKEIMIKKVKAVTLPDVFSVEQANEWNVSECYNSSPECVKH